MKSEEISVHHSKSLCCLRPPGKLKNHSCVKKTTNGCFFGENGPFYGDKIVYLRLK